MRGHLRVYLLVLAALTMYGCSSGPKPPTDTAPDGTAEATAPVAAPPVVPVGVDTAFVVGADSTYGVVLDADDLAEFDEQSASLQDREGAVDTLASVTRFMRLAEGDDPTAYMTAEDSAVVGHLVLRAIAREDAGAALALEIEDALRELAAFSDRADAAATELASDLTDPARAAETRQVQASLRGLSASNRALHQQLATLLAELDQGAMLADSARVQQQVSTLVSDYGRDLDRTINDLGLAAQQIGPAALSPEALRGLSTLLAGKRAAVDDFAERWQQFIATGSLDLADPDRNYNPAEVSRLLQRMQSDLQYLAQQADNRAAALEGAAGFQQELAAREDTEAYLQDLQQTLLDLKGISRSLQQAYQRQSRQYWEGRIDAVASEQKEREQVYKQLDALLAAEGEGERIRADAELVAAYRSLSDRLIAQRRTQLARAGSHDELRRAAQVDLARDLADRARVLGEPSDYAAARAIYLELAAESPGEYAYRYELASLTYHRSRETWAAAETDSLRDAAWDELARCENLLLERDAFDRAMDRAQRELLTVSDPNAAAVTDGDTTGPASAVAGTDPAADWRPPLADYLPQARPDSSRYYYPSLVAQAWTDLDGVGTALDDSEVRGWLLSVDVLRKRLAFDAGAGERFLYQYGRQIYLSGGLNAVEAQRLLKYWSWDDGHLALRRRWLPVTQLPDSTAALATVKRDSLVGLRSDARTAGVRRSLDWRTATVDFSGRHEYDAGLERMHVLLKDVAAQPNPNAEVGAIDSTIVASYPVYLFNRGTFYQQEGKRREAFYCYLGVAERYANDPKTRATAGYSAAALLADGNKRGALSLVRQSTNEALMVLQEDPSAFDPELLVAMYELRQRLAGDLALFDEAIAARDEAGRLRAILASAPPGGTPATPEGGQ